MIDVFEGVVPLHKYQIKRSVYLTFLSQLSGCAYLSLVVTRFTNMTYLIVVDVRPGSGVACRVWAVDIQKLGHDRCVRTRVLEP